MGGKKGENPLKLLLEGCECKRPVTFSSYQETPHNWISLLSECQHHGEDSKYNDALAVIEGGSGTLLDKEKKINLAQKVRKFELSELFLHFKNASQQ